MKFSVKDFSSKCDQIRSLLRIWSHLMKKSLMENVIFREVIQSCFSEMEENFFTKWGIFDNILSENGANFVLK